MRRSNVSSVGNVSHVRTPVSRLTALQQIEVHVFYVALGYFISYLPCALLAEALSSSSASGVDRPVGGLVVIPRGTTPPPERSPMTDVAYAVLEDAGVIPPRHRPRQLTAEPCRRAAAIYPMAVEHRAAGLALGARGARRGRPDPRACRSPPHRRADPARREQAAGERSL